jgi:hypothetical protein
MKLYKKILAFSVMAICFTSCLKDDSNVLDPAKTENVIEFANTANLTSPTTSRLPLLTVNIVMDPGNTYNAAVSYSGANNAPQDITVEVGVADAAVVTAYNTQNSRTYVMLPSNLYTLPVTKVVIPKGSRRVDFPINFATPDQLYGKNYVLPLVIKSASYGQISGNFHTMLYLLNGVNRYDGIFTLKYRFGANDRNYDLATTTWFYSDVQLVTTSATTAVLRNLNAASPFPHVAVSAGLPTSISNLVPQFTFDLATNKITTISNSVAATSTQTKTAVANPAVTDNRFDPATKNVFASFILKETGKADMIINDTLIYKTPR